jgi:DNA recombination protein RmuC
MFIPAEGIYYDLMINEVGSLKSNTRDLLEYAIWEKNVHIVSPNSFYAYLQTILQGLRAFQIENSAKEIKKNVEVLGRHLSAFDSYMQKLGSNLSTTVNSYNTAYKELGKIDKDVVRITEGERQIEPLQIDKPTID